MLSLAIDPTRSDVDLIAPVCPTIDGQVAVDFSAGCCGALTVRAKAMQSREFVISPEDGSWSVHMGSATIRVTYSRREDAIRAAIEVAAASDRRGIAACVIDFADGGCCVLWTSGFDSLSTDK
jgi:hypothetical protein